jgi:polyisoprenyl-teichoic acid--peptidoglycan teichoic acid transferase
MLYFFRELCSNAVILKKVKGNLEKNKQLQKKQEQNNQSTNDSHINRKVLLIACLSLMLGGFLFIFSQTQAQIDEKVPSPPGAYSHEFSSLLPPAATGVNPQPQPHPTEPISPLPGNGTNDGMETQNSSSIQNQGVGDEHAPTPTPPLPTPSPWEGSSRINILLLGLDYGEWDSPDREGPPRTDTMILVSVDTEAKTAGILSIPRDLWVDIPGMVRPNKINAAYRFGEHYNLPGGGPGLAMKTVEQLLGVPVDYYLQMDFYAFERVIDELGGVVLEVQEEIKVHRLAPNGSTILEPGKHLLDGPTALAYARNRSTSGGDFARAERQQQVMLAIRDKALKLDTLPRLILKAPILYREVNSGVKTNLSLDRMIRLAWLAQSISPENIQKGLIGPGQVMDGMSEDGQAILLPVPNQIQYLVNQILMPTPAKPPDITQRMQAEEARLSIVNASGFENLGRLTAAYLESQGAIVERIVEGDEIISNTTIIDFSGKPYTVHFVGRIMMSLPFSQIQSEFDPDQEEDILIILGADWGRNNRLSR